jgi:hypothetical protein
MSALFMAAKVFVVLYCFFAAWFEISKWFNDHNSKA